MGPVHSPFEAWIPYYTLIGSSAAALTGLMFVVITLVSGAQRPRTPGGISTYSTPTVVHFTVALLMSALLCVPWHHRTAPAVVLTLFGAGGVIYACILIVHARRMVSDYKPDAEDWTWFHILPLCGYLLVLAGGATLPFGETATYACGAAAVLFIVIGIHNAWDVVTYLALGQIQGEEDEKP